jgi:hypothetical protein
MKQREPIDDLIAALCDCHEGHLPHRIRTRTRLVRGYVATPMWQDKAGADEPCGTVFTTANGVSAAPR